MWFTNHGNDSIGRVTPEGEMTFFTDPEVSEPWGITAGPDGAMWFTNRGTSTIGRIQAVEPETVTFIARYSDERCATIETVADAHGVDAAQVVGHGVHRLGLLADAGHDAAPVAEAPANDGPCEVAVTHPVKDAAMIETRAAQWAVDADELHHLGGQLVLAIIYVLAVGG